MLILILGACSGGVPDWTPKQSPAPAVRPFDALVEICLPALIEDRPVADLAKARGLSAVVSDLPIADRAMPRRQVWQHPADPPVYLVEMPANLGRACALYAETAEPESARQAAFAALTDSAIDFRLTATSGGATRAHARYFLCGQRQGRHFGAILRTRPLNRAAGVSALEVDLYESAEPDHRCAPPPGRKRPDLPEGTIVAKA